MIGILKHNAYFVSYALYMLYVFPSEKNLSIKGLIQSVQQSEQRTFARTRVSYYGSKGAFLYAKINVLKNFFSAVGKRERSDLYYIACIACGFLFVPFRLFFAEDYLLRRF